MTVLNILKYPDRRLHTVARPVQVVNDRIRQIVADMAETMYDAPGIGLAATQVDIHERIVVIDLSESRDQLRVFINPEILMRSPETGEYEEGCLSVPAIYDLVERPLTVRIRALGLDGQPFELDADGLLAVCIQHEIDHLEGRVFVQHLSRLKQTRIRTRLQKEQRDQERAGG